MRNNNNPFGISTYSALSSTCSGNQLRIVSTNRRHVKYSFKDGMIITVSSCISESMSQTLPYWFGLTRDCLAIAARLFQIDSAQASVRKKPKQTPFFSDPKPSQMHIVMVRTRTNVSTSKWTEPVDEGEAISNSVQTHKLVKSHHPRHVALFWFTISSQRIYLFGHWITSALMHNSWRQ